MWVPVTGSRKSPGGGNASPLQSSCLENPVGRGAWRNVVRGVAKSRTRLSDSVRQHVSSSWLSRDSHRSSVLIPSKSHVPDPYVMLLVV